MTGRTLFRVPLRRMSEEAEAANPITGIPVLPRTLKDAGYTTLRTGKIGNYPRFAAQEFHKNIVVAHSVNGSARHADNAIEFLRNQQPESDLAEESPYQSKTEEMMDLLRSLQRELGDTAKL